MGTIATVLIRNKRNGKQRRINEHEWAHDLGTGKYDGWERIGAERHGDKDQAAVVNSTAAEAAAKAQREADARAEAEQAAAVKAAEEEAAREAEESKRESTEDDDTVSTDEPAGDEDTEGLL